VRDCLHDLNEWKQPLIRLAPSALGTFSPLRGEKERNRAVLSKRKKEHVA
jgi:hypothetical protein